MRHLALSLLCCAGLAAAEPYVWIEAESATDTNLTDQHPNVSHHEALSGGVSIGIDPQSTDTRYWRHTITVPSAGTWHLYVHKFWKHGPFKWRFDDGAWTELTKSNTMLLESQGLGRKHQTISWVRLGEVDLPAGEVTLEVEGLEQSGAFVLDCFVLSQIPYQPMGLRKPGEKTGLADPGSWAFEPDYDTHEQQPVIDLRGLNETVAGEHGFVRRSDDGADFVRGDGKPIRFWPINTYIQRSNSLETVGKQAANLAKRGVNMVRFHGHFAPGKGSALTDVNEDAINQLWLLVAGMKQHGIYTTVSPYWGTHTNVEASWNYTKGTNGKMTAVLFWDPELQEAYKGWWRKALTEPNPYTGIALKDDPALAIIQLQNEDSMLFHTMSRLGPEATKQLQGYYATWLKERGLKGDTKLFPIWQLADEMDKGNDEAMARQVQFYTETMYDFNAMMVDFLRNELGCQQLVNAGNWKPGSMEKLGDAERYSYTAADIIGVNRYVNGGAPGQPGHINPNDKSRAGYQINAGDLFSDISCTKVPGKIATTLRQVAGQPMMIYESQWVPPMSKQSEGPFLIATYQSLTGIDGYYWFCTSAEHFATTIGKWQIADPMQLGSFPAAAWMFRKGLLKQGQPVVHEERSLTSIWNRTHPALPEKMGFDPNRDSAFIAKDSGIATAIDPRAFLVGPVEVVYGGDPAKSTVADLDRYIDGDVITANTGEVVMDTATGLCTVNAEQAQGATGHLRDAGRIALADLTIEATNDYATVLAVATDDRPLASSKRVFLQVTTSARPYGWRQEAGTFKHKGDSFTGFKITNTGQSPWNVVDTAMTVTIANPGLRRATLCDANLYPLEEIPVTTSGGSLRCSLPANAMYVLFD